MKCTYFLLLSFLACATAYKCCPPTQYECLYGQMGGFYVESTKQAGLLSAAANVHSDGKNGKVAFSEEVNSGGHVSHVKVVQDFKKSVQYLVIDGVCTKTALPGTFDDNACIPDDAQFITTIDYGIGALQANVFLYNVVQMGSNTTAYVAVKTTDCVPIGTNNVVVSAGTTTVVSGGFVNVTLGIKDPSVFDVPASCDHTFPIKKMQDTYPGSDYMKALIDQFKHAWSN
ncbi:ependymin-related protein 1-like [Ptychodera flava]|uniref:ependymin-related protein 1-like n=1 Tax=Ptychodera flava TaxID=63121 RepID=UPI003969C649